MLAPPTMQPPIFELRQASTELGGRTVLRPLDLMVHPGEAVAVVGPSGAGKTTLLRVLAGLQPLSSGQVRVQGEELAGLYSKELRRSRSRIGFVHQDHALVPTLRASQNVISGALGRRSILGGLRDLIFPKQGDLERAHRLLERVGVGEQLFQRTDTLSGGERQRVAIARALFQDPVALLADEPVASVDPVRARDLIDLLTGLAKERKLALVASLHDLDLARRAFPRIVALRDGHVLYDGPSAELTDDLVKHTYALADKPAQG
ncbi:MAG: phosphonate transport system ATP-binding protein [Planctomycetota bacterium]|jgi:phosphonate transport system ATP-binding protein